MWHQYKQDCTSLNKVNSPHTTYRYSEQGQVDARNMAIGKAGCGGVQDVTFFCGSRMGNVWAPPVR